MEIQQIEDGGELKKQKTAQCHGLKPITNDLHYF
jgi:hypothetical protein